MEVIPSESSNTGAEIKMKGLLEDSVSEAPVDCSPTSNGNDNARLNGEVNGRCEEDMEVGDSIHGCEEKSQADSSSGELCRSPEDMVLRHEEGEVEEVDAEEEESMDVDSDNVNSNNGEVDGVSASDLSSSNTVPLSVGRTLEDPHQLVPVANGLKESNYQEEKVPGEDSDMIIPEDEDNFDDVEDCEDIPNEDELLDGPSEETDNLKDTEEVSSTVTASEEMEASEETINKEVSIPADVDVRKSEKDTNSVPEKNLSENENKDLKENETSEKGNDENVTLRTPTKEIESGDPEGSVPDNSPDKSAKKKKTQPLTITPRRSSRNLNKTKSYVDEDEEVQEVITQDSTNTEERKVIPKKHTIVVNDTKRLAEIAAGSKNNKGGKKEPTLVIIDTNSLMGSKSSSSSSQSTSSNITPQMTITPSQPRMPIVSVSQNLFASKSVKMTPVPSAVSTSSTQSQHKAQPQPHSILPSLTDDMYVVEAPSFIVPYVYEKPPVNTLKEFLKDLEKTLKEQEEELKKKAEELKKKEEEEELKKKEEEEEAKKLEQENKEKEEELKKNEAESEEQAEETPGPKENVEDKDLETTKDSGKVESANEPAQEQNEVPEVKEPETAEAKKTPEEEKKEPEPAKEKTEETKEPSKTEKTEKESEKATDTKKADEVLEDKTNKKSESYFENPLGKFFMQIGINLVQEHVQADILRNKMRKKEKEGPKCSTDISLEINSLTKILESTKENNEPFKFEMKKCQLCNFKTESQLVMAHHLETPHMRNFVYRCNFCNVEVRSPHDILFHMEAEHNVRGRLERSPAFHQCPNCPFEDNQKGKLSRHLLSCAKKYKPERNQEPPLEWEPPAKIPRVRGSRGLAGSSSVIYPPSLSPRIVNNPLGRLSGNPSVLSNSLGQRNRGRPPIYVQRYPASHKALAAHIRQTSGPGSGMVYRPPPALNNSQPPVLLPAPFLSAASAASTHPALQKTRTSGGQQNQGVSKAGPGTATAKLLQQPSISITPLPRGPSASSSSAGAQVKPGRPPGSAPSKTAFVICEICDGYIKDLEQLRNHMQWIHKVKIHPKMIYNRPPLNCQKCQFRFFTDQGLERHLLGSHGLVTSSMQEAANKGKDGGRCPVCGRVYQWKLLNHVARDHNMSLKPAHLSYKCTVCTATFGMYKQFENHVYSAHSVVAKRVIDKNKGGSSSGNQPSTSSGQNSTPNPVSSSSSSSSSTSDPLLKPLKINDEITIIPQPAKSKNKLPAVTVKPATK